MSKYHENAMAETIMQTYRGLIEKFVFLINLILFYKICHKIAITFVSRNDRRRKKF